MWVTTAIAWPTIDAPDTGPKARESQALDRLSPKTKYWSAPSVVLAIAFAPTGPERGLYQPFSCSVRPSTKIVCPIDQIVWPGIRFGGHKW